MRIMQRQFLKIPAPVKYNSRKIKAAAKEIRRLNLTTLKNRRTRGDLIETFKVKKGLEKI